MKCEFCQKELTYKNWEKNSRMVTITRKHCDRKCANMSKGVNPISTRYRVLKINGRRISEHRWVMEQHLGRQLESHEYVHHIDGNKLNNDINNLKVVSAKEHGIEHTYHPTQKECCICKKVFIPHKTKRKRQQQKTKSLTKTI